MLTAACATVAHAPAAPVDGPWPIYGPYAEPVAHHWSAAAETVDRPETVRGQPRRTPTAAAAVPAVVGTGWEAWAASPAARAVEWCESRDDPRSINPAGYYGLWQMNASFWATYGGLRFGSRPDLATVAEQDQVAYQGWLARGWEPWSCARIA